MPYLNKPFKHDVFISYGHGDFDGDGASPLKQWSLQFAEKLRRDICQVRLFRDFDLFIEQARHPDQSLDPTESLVQQLEKVVDASALLLIIMSPDYLGSEWCKKELQWWLDANKNSPFDPMSRIFICRAMPNVTGLDWDAGYDDESWPDEFKQGLVGFWFHSRKDVDFGTKPFFWDGSSNDLDEYNSAMLELVRTVTRRLHDLKQRQEDNAQEIIARQRMPDQYRQVKVFVSYAQADMVSRDGFKLSRVGQILRDISHELAVHSEQSRFRLVMEKDPALPSGADVVESIHQAIDECDIGLVLLSGAYSFSENCAEELRLLLEKGKTIVPVETDKVWDDDIQHRLSDLRETIEAVISVRFWGFVDDAYGLYGWPEPDTAEGESKQRYARAMWELREGMNARAREIAQATITLIEQTSSPTDHYTVFIASPTSDVRPHADRLEIALQKDGYSVFRFDPDRMQSGADVSDELEKSISKADVFIQLLGAVPGRMLTENGQQLVPFQYETAKKLNARMQVWRSAKFDIGGCAPDYAEFLNGIASHVTSFEEFESYMREAMRTFVRTEGTATKPPELPHDDYIAEEDPDSATAYVYLSCSRSQYELAERTAISIRAWNYEAFYDEHTLREGDLFVEAFRAHIRNARVFVFLISPDSVRPDAFSLAELEIARERWEEGNYRVLPVMAESTPLEDVPEFLEQFVTLEPSGNFAAVVSAEVDRLMQELARAGQEMPPHAEDDIDYGVAEPEAALEGALTESSETRTNLQGTRSASAHTAGAMRKLGASTGSHIQQGVHALRRLRGALQAPVLLLLALLPVFAPILLGAWAYSSMRSLSIAFEDPEIGVSRLGGLIPAPRTDGVAAHREAITDIRFFADGNYAVTASYDGTLKVWDGNSGVLVAAIETTDHREPLSVHVDGPRNENGNSSNLPFESGQDAYVWSQVTGSGSESLLQAYLDAFPNGLYRPLAAVQIQQLHQPLSKCQRLDDDNVAFKGLNETYLLTTWLRSERIAPSVLDHCELFLFDPQTNRLSTVDDQAELRELTSESAEDPTASGLEQPESVYEFRALLPLSQLLQSLQNVQDRSARARNWFHRTGQENAPFAVARVPGTEPPRFVVGDSSGWISIISLLGEEINVLPNLQAADLEIATLLDGLPQHPDGVPVTAIAVAPSGDAMFSVDRHGGILEWSINDLELLPVRWLNEPSPQTHVLISTPPRGGLFFEYAKLSPTAGIFAAAWSDGANRGHSVFETSTGSLQLNSVGPLLQSIAFHPDDLRYLEGTSAGTRLVAIDGTEIQELDPAGTSVTATAIDSTGRFYAAASSDGKVRLWREAGSYIFTKEVSAVDIGLLNFSAGGEYLAVGGENGFLEILETERGRVVSDVSDHRSDVTDAAFDDTGELIAIAHRDGTFRVVDYQRDSISFTTSAHSSELTSIEFNKSGDLIVTASRDGTARLWDASSGAEIATMEGHEGGTLDAGFDLSGENIITISATGQIKIWSLSALRARVCEGCTSAEISEDGTYAIFAGSGGTAHVWVPTVEAFTGFYHGAPVARAFVVDRSTTAEEFDVIAVTVGDDGTAKVWKVFGGALLRTISGHGNHLSHAAVSPDGSRLLTASWDGTVRLSRLDAPDWLGLFELPEWVTDNVMIASLFSHQ